MSLYACLKNPFFWNLHRSSRLIISYGKSGDRFCKIIPIIGRQNLWRNSFPFISFKYCYISFVAMLLILRTVSGVDVLFISS